MAAESAKKFVEQINSDPAMQEKIQKASARMVEIGKEHGHDFTQDELQDELRRRWGVSKAKDDPDTCSLF